jgi:hypothetical protein
MDLLGSDLVTPDYDLLDTQFGFVWGPLAVRRLTDDPKFGVIIEIQAGTNIIEIRSSPSGRLLKVTHK